MTDSPDRDERHLARMLRKKAVIDERIANSPNECGLLLVLTGNGKGKSSSAFGMLARAMGHGMQCGVVQFIKGRHSTGEELFFRRFPEQVRFHVMGEGFTWETQDRNATSPPPKPPGLCPARCCKTRLSAWWCWTN